MNDSSLRPSASAESCNEDRPARKFAHLENMDAAAFKAMVLRCIYAFDREPLDKTRPFGMAAAALFICNGAAEADAATFRASLGGCSAGERETGDWEIVVQRADVAKAEGPNAGLRDGVAGATNHTPDA